MKNIIIKVFWNQEKVASIVLNFTKNLKSLQTAFIGGHFFIKQDDHLYGGQWWELDPKIGID